MNIGRICNREVVVTTRGEALSQAAREMCERHVGMIIVTEERAGRRFPVGVVTDRDIVRTQLGRAADLYCLSVEEAMTGRPLLLAENEPIVDAIGRLRMRGVRRAPVVSADGALVGVVSMDDLLVAISEELSDLSRLVASQPSREKNVRSIA